MTTQVVTVDVNAELEQAMGRMQTHGIRHLAVTNGERPVGFLSMRDLMNHELARRTDELHHMRAYIHSA